MTTSAHEFGDSDQPLPGTENQPEFQRWDKEQRENDGGESGEKSDKAAKSEKSDKAAKK